MSSEVDKYRLMEIQSSLRDGEILWEFFQGVGPTAKFIPSLRDEKSDCSVGSRLGGVVNVKILSNRAKIPAQDGGYYSRKGC